MAEPVTQYYPQNPWQSVETNQRTPWYYPQLYNVYRRSTIYNRFVSTEFNHNGPKATELVVSSLLPPHSNHNPIGVRDMWLDSSYMDSFNRRIRFQRYGGKLSLNKYDDMITFWEKDNTRGLRNIINGEFGQMMTRTLDKLARDAFFKAPFSIYGDGSGGWGGTGFNNITANDTVSTDLIIDVRLGMKERGGVPLVDDETGIGGTIVCVTSPGVMRDLRSEASSNGNANAFIDVQKYSNPQSIIRGEVGTYQGVRFIEHPDAILYNTGAIIHQATITSPVMAGDGAPDPMLTAVDNVEYVGQGNRTHFIQVNDATGFAVGDYLTIHVQRTNARGVTNGVDHTDGKLMNVRAIAVNTVDHQITFERPIMEDFKVDLGGSVYGYVTKARHIHTMLYLTGNDGVVTGVAQPPQIVMPRPFDDLEMMYRVSWHAYMGWQPFNKNAFEVVYLAGSNRMVGPRFI